MDEKFIGIGNATSHADAFKIVKTEKAAPLSPSARRGGE
jgi:hypothetical protein